MAENTRKPNYDDLDWTFLIQDREAKWAEMMEGLAADGILPVDLWEGAQPKVPHPDGFSPKLLLLPVQPGEPRGVLIVCAGGGFRFKSSNEARPVAEYFHARGINAAILDYSVDSAAEMGSDASYAVRRAAGEDGLRAIRYLRFHARQLGILPDKIAIGGFSAGGMVSAYAAARYEPGNPDAADPLERVSSRPDAALLMYSSSPSDLQAIGGVSTPYHAENARREAELATDVLVHTDCPPFFLMQTAADDPRRCLHVAMRLANLGIPFEVHMFEKGMHGQGLYDGGCEDSPLEPHTAKWADVAASWLIHNREF